MQHIQTHPSQVGFYKPHQLPTLLNCGKAHVYRLLNQGEIPRPEHEKDGTIIGFPINEIHTVVESRRLNLPKDTRLEIVKRLEADRKIDYAGLAEQFLTIH